MTPDTRAARDRLAAYLDGADQHAADWADTYRRGEFIHSTNTRRPAYAGEPDIPSVGLRWDDLRLLLAALDEHEAIAAHDRRAAQHVREQWEHSR